MILIQDCGSFHFSVFLRLRLHNIILRRKRFKITQYCVVLIFSNIGDLSKARTIRSKVW